MTSDAPVGWPAGRGEMAERIRAHDWSATPLGPVEHWPPSLRAIVDMMLPNGFPMVVLWGPRLVQLYNDSYRAIMGIKHPAGLGQPTHECWPEVRHINVPIYERVLAGETLTFQDALYPLTRSGRLEDAWFTLSFSPLRDESGQVAGILVTVLETTERHRAEVALRESEARFRSLVEPFAQAVWETDTQGRVVTDSPSWRAYTGQTVDEYLGDGWTAAVHSDDREEVLRAWNEAVRTVAPLTAEFRLRGPDGGWRWTHVRSAPLRNADGSVRKWVGMNIDITARKQAEAARRESEERYRTLFDSIDEGFCIVQVLFDAEQRPADCRYLEINPAFERHSGIHEAPGRTFREILPGIEPLWIDTYGRVALTGEPTRFEGHAVSMGRWFDVYAFRIGEPHERKVAILFTDITRRKQVERALRERVDFERQLIGIVSHDLRNPLNAILLSVTMLMRRPVLDARQSGALRCVLDAAERMRRLVCDLLDFTQVRLGQGLPVQRELLDLHALARRVVDEVLAAHPEREVELRSEGEVWASLDADRIAQLLANLLSNALAYGAADSPVRVTTREDGSNVVLEVHNWGEPIPPEKLARLFQPLERGAQPSTQSSRSIGLGLFIVDCIVRAHGGRIRVHSTAEEGTTFSVQLPRGG